MPFDPSALIKILPYVLGHDQMPAVMEGMRRAQAKRQQDQQLASQDALRQAQMGNLAADNQRSDEAAAMNRLSQYLAVAPKLAQTAAATAEDPVAANLGLAKQLTGAAQSFGVDPALGQSFVPNMTEVVSGKKKKRAQELYADMEKTYGAEAMAADSITANTPDFGPVKPSQLRALFQPPVTNAQGAPATPYVKPSATNAPELGSFGEFTTATPERKAQILKDRQAYQRAGDKPTVTPPEKPVAPEPGVKLSPTQMDELATMDAVKAMATKAVALGDKTNWAGVGGMGAGTLSEFAAKNFGAGSPEGQDLRNYLGQIKGTIAKLRGGTSFTPNEQRLLDTYTPGINDHPMVIKSKIKSLFDFIDAKRAALHPQAGNEGWIDLGNGVRVREKR